MIVTAALNWWNETPERLTEAVTSVASFADRVVAFDGAYRRYPGATAASDPAQRDAILEAAVQAGLEPDITVPVDVWDGQCAKRTALMQYAAHGSDWVFVLDADYVVTADRESVRRQLACGAFDVYEVPLVTPEGEYATNWHRAQAAIPQSWTPLMFRAFEGFRVEDHHWWYSALKDGERVWLWGDDDRYPRLAHGALSDLVVTHTTNLRSHEETMAARSWYNDVARVVAATGQEDDRPDLPAPVIDTESMLI